jgi:hypothetical protein
MILLHKCLESYFFLIFPSINHAVIPCWSSVQKMKSCVCVTCVLFSPKLLVKNVLLLLAIFMLPKTIQMNVYTIIYRKKQKISKIKELKD